MKAHVQLTEYWREQSPVTHPRSWQSLLSGFPKEIPDMMDWLHHVLIHHWRAMLGQQVLTEDRAAEIEIRPVARLLERIYHKDPSSWGHERPIDQKVVVDCRHFAVLLCAILRDHGYPARVRHGFASYLQNSHHQSHVLCEVWWPGQGRWVRLDPDQRKVDVSEPEFLTAPEAWVGCQDGSLSPGSFGYSSEARGLWCVRWEVVRDLAALNKEEMLTFDVWGLNAAYPYDANLNREDEDLINEVCRLSLDVGERWAQLHELYLQDPRIRVPNLVQSSPYTTGRTTFVDLVAEGSLETRR